jgi:rod shape-determining protein MreC
MRLQNQLLSRLVVFIAISLFLIIFDNFHLLSFPKKIILSVTTPIEYGIYTFYQSAGEAFSFLGFWKNGYQELAFLKERNAALSVDAALTVKLKEENEILKKQFATANIETGKLLPARIGGFGRFLIIDKGKNDGVSEGNIVLLGNIYIGKIKLVQDNIAKVELATDPDARIAAGTTQTRAKGIVRGSFGAEVLFTEVLQAEVLKIDDTIESFASETMPAGLLIGKIVQVENVDSAVFQSAKARPLIDYGKLTTVFVKIE